MIIFGVVVLLAAVIVGIVGLLGSARATRAGTRFPAWSLDPVVRQTIDEGHVAAA